MKNIFQSLHVSECSYDASVGSGREVVSHRYLAICWVRATVTLRNLQVPVFPYLSSMFLNYDVVVLGVIVILIITVIVVGWCWERSWTRTMLILSSLQSLSSSSSQSLSLDDAGRGAGQGKCWYCHPCSHCHLHHHCHCHRMMLEEELDKDNAYRQATDRPIEDDNRTAVGQVTSNTNIL